MTETISPNTTIAQYTIVSKISEGGMGEVWRARDGRLDRNVAIKILPAKLAADADRLNRFEQEARATSALNHPNILTVYDIGTHDGSPYIVAALGDAANMIQVRLSPDQKRTAVARRDPNTGVFDLWVIDVARGAASRITTGPTDVTDCVWSPDNNFIAWGATKDQRYTIMRKLASGAGQEEVLLETDRPVFPTGWSSDGKFILYSRREIKTGNDVWVLPLEGERKPFAFFQSPADDTLAVFSPDGHWVAYQSSESGINPEIYVQTFPASGDKKPVSTKGGLRPRWRADGKELFYITPEGKTMAVEIKAGSMFEPGVPNLLFDVANARVVPTAPYDVAADGQRFLFMSGRVDSSPSSLAVVLNWTSDLKK